MSEMAKLREPYLTLFKLILKYFDDPKTDGLLHSADFRTVAALGYNSGLIRSGLNWLVEKGFLYTVRDDHGYVTGWIFSEKGVETSYAMIAGIKSDEYYETDLSADSASAEDLGASDMFLDLTEHPTELREAIENLDALREAVRSDNSLFARNEDRLTVMSEVEFFRNTINTGSIRNATALGIIGNRGTLRWLADKAAGGVVSKIATGAIIILLKLFGLG